MAVSIEKQTAVLCFAQTRNTLFFRLRFQLVIDCDFLTCKRWSSDNRHPQGRLRAHPRLLRQEKAMKETHTDFNDSDRIECYALAHATATAAGFDDLHHSVSVATENQICNKNFWHACKAGKSVRQPVVYEPCTAAFHRPINLCARC